MRSALDWGHQTLAEQSPVQSPAAECKPLGHALEITEHCKIVTVPFRADGSRETKVWAGIKVGKSHDMQRTIIFSIAAALIFLCVPVCGGAEQDTTSQWELHVRPYVWITGLEGTLSGSGIPQIKINKSFGDILEEFDSGALLAIEGRRGKYGFYSDILLVRLRDSGVVPPGIPAQVRTTTTSALLCATREITRSQLHSVSAAAGIRYWSLDLSASIDSPQPPTPINVARETSWVDPGLGLTGKYQAGPKFQIDGAVIVFPGSKVSWDAGLNLYYSLSGTTKLTLGYRYLTLKRDRLSFGVDAKLQGPVIGLDFRL